MCPARLSARQTFLRGLVTKSNIGKDFRNSFTEKMFEAKERKERKKGVRREEERCWEVGKWSSEIVSSRKCSRPKSGEERKVGVRRRDKEG